MIDIDNFRRAIQWLRRGLAEVQHEPVNPVVQLSLLQSFEVTYNLAEELLRQVCVESVLGPDAAFLSTRELIWRASEEGLVFATRKEWAQYGLALESMRDACMLSTGESVKESFQLFSQFAQLLDSFADSLQERLACHV